MELHASWCYRQAPIVTQCLYKLHLGVSAIKGLVHVPLPSTCAHSLRTHLLQYTMPGARHQAVVRLAQVCYSGHCMAGAGPAARACHHFSTSPRLWNSALQGAVGVGLWPAELAPCSRRATGRETVKKGHWVSESRSGRAPGFCWPGSSETRLHSTAPGCATGTRGRGQGQGLRPFKGQRRPAVRTPEGLPQTAARPDTHLLR